MPAVWAIIVKAVINSTGLQLPCISATTVGMVGIKVGITTPLVLLNQLKIPALILKIGVAVEGVITLAKATESIFIPSNLIIKFINGDELNINDNDQTITKYLTMFEFEYNTLLYNIGHKIVKNNDIKYLLISGDI